MNGQWIWYGGPDGENTAGCFAQSFFWDGGEPVLLRLTARTRYVACCNGREVGRGPIRSSKNRDYVDELDLTPYLRRGKNYLAVRVWSYGWSTYQTIGGPGGLCFDLVQDRLLACSGSETRAARDLGLKAHTVKRNVNLGFMENYDARRFDCGWMEDEGLTDSWQGAEVLTLESELLPRPLEYYNVQPRYPKRLVSWEETVPGCQQISVNTRPVFFPERIDADETILSAFLGTMLVSPKDQEGMLVFPNRTWNGLIGSFKIDGELYPVSNQQREIPIHLKKGKQLFLLELSGKFDDLFCHMEWSFSEEIAFEGLLHGEPEFFAIGPTQIIQGQVDGITRVYGGLNEFNRLESQTAEHEKIFSCSSAKALVDCGTQWMPIPKEYIFQEEYIFSVVRREKTVCSVPVTEDLCRVLWNNTTPLLVPPPSQGEFTRLILDFGQLYVGNFEFTLSAPAGTILDVYCFENMFENEIDYTVGLNNSFRYICRDGCQTYRCLSRMGCRFALLTLRKHDSSVKLYQFGMQASGYPDTGMGVFQCSDALLNQVWEASKNTHLLCMEDAFTDCPTFEQSFWIGDAQISAAVNGVLCGSWELMRRCLLLAPEDLGNTPLCNALAPTDWRTAIPMWTMNWMLSIEEYVEITGDSEILEPLYPTLTQVLENYIGFITAEGGFLINAWNMVDWAAMDIENHGIVTGQQAILAHCLEFGAQCADGRGDGERAEKFQEKADLLRQFLQERLWDPGKNAFLDGWTPEHGFSKTYSMQTHALMALYHGFTDPQKERRALELLKNPPPDMVQAGSPFLLFHQYELWIRDGNYDAVLGDIRERWGRMLRYDCTTCWEVFPGFYENGRTRSYCHSWSSTPVYFLGKYLLGIRRTSPGFRSITVEIPDTDLTWCQGSLPTPLGMITVWWSREEGKKSCKLFVPAQIDLTLPDDGWEYRVTRV